MNLRQLVETHGNTVVVVPMASDGRYTVGELVLHIEAAIDPWPMSDANPLPATEDGYRRRIAALERELAEAKDAYNGLVLLLERRFPRNSDGSLPDHKIEEVLRENERLVRTLHPFGQDKYATEDGWLMRREHGETPNGNPIAGRWVLRNERGELVDFDKYRSDLAERNGLAIAVSPNTALKGANGATAE